MKIAFVFPGQGSQYRGMGKDVYDHYSQAREVYQQADDILGGSVSRMCFEGTDEELLSTINQQPTIHTTEIAILRAIESQGVHADMAAGFSLGEYAATVCAQMMAFGDTIQLVRKRGVYIQKVIPEGVGKMVAILGLDRPVVEEIVREASKVGTVECSNYNCPGNTVVSGYNNAVDQAVEQAMARGAKKVAQLKVSAPFHTSLIKQAGAQMAEELRRVTIKDPAITYIPNVTAQPFQPNMDEVDILNQHIWKPVRWEETMRTMVALGVDLIAEIGPSGGLTGNNKRTIDTIAGAKVHLMKVETATQIQELVRLVNP